MISHITAIETLAIILLLLATLMSFYRLLFGPSNADRVISADALSLIATVFLVVLALLFDSILYLDIALIYAVLSFVGIIALAKVIETGKSRGEH